MRITVALADGRKVIAEPTLLDLRDADIDLGSIPDGDLVALAELVYVTASRVSPGEVPETLDRFLASIPMDPERWELDLEPDPPTPERSDSADRSGLIP